MLLRKKKKEKENSFNFENKQKKRFQISCSNCTLHWKTNFLWYKNLLQHSCALFDAMIAKLPPIPPLTSYLCFLAFIFFCLLINQPSNLKIHTEIKPPPPEKKLRLCSLQVINTSSHILCLFVMVNKKKKSKQKQQQNQ